MNKEENTISLDEAKVWTQEWRQDESDYNKYNPCPPYCDDSSALN